MKKKILISAYTFYNVGDDLFIKILCDRYKEATFYLMAPNMYKNHFNSISNLIIIPSDKFLFRLFNKIISTLNHKSSLFLLISRFMDCIVIIGGSLFIENNNWKNRFELSNQKHFKDINKFIIGANFGPYSSPDFYNEFKKAYSNFNDICFRDNYSYDLFKMIPQVRKANDIVFSLNSELNISKKNEISISVINLKNRDLLSTHYEKYLLKMIELTKFFIEKDILVNILSFCEYEGDFEIAKEIYNSLSEIEMNKCVIINYNSNLQQILDSLKNSNLIIASRFHAMILGWKYKASVIPLVYSKKMLNVIDDLKFNGYYKRIEEIDQLDLNLVYKEYLNHKIFDISYAEEDSSNQFFLLDSYMKGNEE